MSRVALLGSCSLIIATALCPASAYGKKPFRKDIEFFEKKIRPVLVKHCYECHAADAEELGGRLRLDTRQGMRDGGESGPAVVDGNPDTSLIVQALRYDGIEMPPDEPLSESVINDFVSWIRRGAPDPRFAKPAKVERPKAPSTDLWSLQPVENPEVPEVRDRRWPSDPLDQFVLARIESKRLRPTHDAEPRILARRLHVDLTGLPPSIREVDEFERDYRQRGGLAVEDLVDALLARPQFGERWGRHWLDVARYGESNGNDGLGRNPTFPHAWRYRDYVIDALNDDRPYDQFLAEQIAGDLLPSDSPTQRDRYLVATGFLAIGSKPAKAMNNNFAMDVVADQIDVIGQGVMGLSVACARCHDHKFDPISTQDYYALAGNFTSSETMWGVAANEKLTAPPTDLHVLEAAPKVLPPKDFVETVVVLDSNTGKPKAVPKSKWPAGTPLAMGLRDRDMPADCKINIKGDAKKLGNAVPRGFLTACEVESSVAAPIGVDPKQSGRLQLAQWLTSASHPLTARVMVNRVWMHLFGEGLVRTPNDFGVYGEQPTHPQLLDHLASRFVDNGWSLKRLIRTIVLSRTYQLSSRASAELVEADAENLLWARHSLRRLDAESLRDSMLAASGQLDPTPADGSIIRHRDILVNRAGNLHLPSRHRSVYLCYLRDSAPPELAPFDLPSFVTTVAQRDVSTVPGQSLHLYNSPFVIEQARHLAQLATSHAKSDDARVRMLFRRTLCRDPAPAELRGAIAMVNAAAGEFGDKGTEKAWEALAQAMLTTNEFRYVD
ncbi:Planctomycete cytochrome C [Planctomycetes bacterium Pan216]|uniref:Planctomycete cytochrome C n=1 Tax=Kolteria novifilia TaxID=2527975 RepID=A0A518AZU4_9BACT|nr:Planctomycete cytochrome C [Planctomycetes bacterium Pan216]